MTQSLALRRLGSSTHTPSSLQTVQRSTGFHLFFFGFAEGFVFLAPYLNSDRSNRGRVFIRFCSWAHSAGNMDRQADEETKLKEKDQYLLLVLRAEFPNGCTRALCVGLSPHMIGISFIDLPRRQLNFIVDVVLFKIELCLQYAPIALFRRIFVFRPVL